MDGSNILAPFSGSPDSASYVDGGSEEKNIKGMMEDCYARTIAHNQSYWTEADIDSRLLAGDQTIWYSMYGSALPNNRRMFHFNRVRRIINMISGNQRRNRKQIVASPVENADERGASQWTSILSTATRISNAYDYISEGFEGAITTGLNLLHVWRDMKSDPISGDLMISNYSYSGFLIDPYFRRPDLSDCKFIWTRRQYTKQQVKFLLPGREEQIDSMPVNYRDMRFTYLPNTYDFMMSERLAYDEFYHLSQKEATFLIDTKTGEAVEYRGDEERLGRFLAAHPEIIVNKILVPYAKLAIAVNGHIMYSGDNLLGICKYPFVPIFAYYNPDLVDYSRRIQGVVRDLRDPQFLYNRRRVTENDILESQINTGWLFKADALVDPNDVFMTGQGRGLAIKEEYPIADAVQRINPPEIPQSMLQLSELLAREVMEVSGVNEELLGSADDDKAGILSMLRQGAGLTTLQKLYDQLDISQRLLGQVFMEAIQANYTDGKLSRILGEPVVPEIANKIMNRYDIAIEAGTMTQTQKQLEMVQLVELAKMGVPIPPEELLKASTIQNKDKIMEAVQQNQKQQNELNQSKMQAEIALLQAQIENLKAQAIANVGLGQERVSRIEENKALAVERLHEARKDDEVALLNMIKAIKELQNMDIDRVARQVEILNAIRETGSEPKADASLP